MVVSLILISKIGEKNVYIRAGKVASFIFSWILSNQFGVSKQNEENDRFEWR